MSKKPDLDHAKMLLGVIQGALPRAREIHDTVAKWSEDRNPPPLQREGRRSRSRRPRRSAVTLRGGGGPHVG